MLLLKTLQVFVAASILLFMPVISVAKTPAYYHYYYVYPETMTWCGKLVEEVFTNTDRNCTSLKRNSQIPQQHFQLVMCVGFTMPGQTIEGVLGSHHHNRQRF